MSILIGCDSFLSLRNVRNGELGRRLAPRRVIALCDPGKLEGAAVSAPSEVKIGPLLNFDSASLPAFRALEERMYLARKCAFDPATIWQEFKFSSHRHHSGNWFRGAASLAKHAGVLAGYWVGGRGGRAQRWRQEYIEALRRLPIMDDYVRLFEREEAELVAAFSLEGKREKVLVEAARKAGLPTAVVIRSRDNLAAKIQHLPDADRYFVWSDATRNFMLRLFPEIEPEKVIVTGAPQFDRHLNPAYRMDRDLFFRTIGLDPDRPLVVYTMVTPGLCDHEIEITQHLADAARDGKLARRAQLLVRGHPRMFGSDWKLLKREYDEARVWPRPSDLAYRGPEHEAIVVRQVQEDEPMHLATLAYQDVQVNVNGTMTIDSAIMDKPTVNVEYDLVKVPSGLSVKHFYARTDSLEMRSYGASRFARSPEDCIRLINEYLEDPAMDAQGRERARQQDCGPLDGRAGERIAAGLIALCGARPSSYISPDLNRSRERAQCR